MTNVANLRALRHTTDPIERAQRAAALLQETEEFRTELADIRRRAVVDMRNQGMSYREIGGLLGISRSRAEQIANA